MNAKTLIIGIPLYCLMFGISSCQNGNERKTNQQASDTVSTVGVDTASIKLKQIPFPKNVAILLPTQYRKESTGYPKGVKEKEWYEIYRVNQTGEWRIAKADLDISYGRDECVGDDVMIIRSEHEDAKMFFTPFEGLSENPTTILENKPLFPERTLAFDFKGNGYRLSATGNMIDDEGHILPIAEIQKMDEETLGFTRITAYKLHFTAPNNISYELATIDEMQSSTPKVIWAGDLNADGLPDLILDLSDFYESRHLFFFLSDPNDKEEPLKKVADLQVVNDC